MYKILIVDDDIILNNAIIAFLKNEKFFTISCHNVYQVLIYLKHNHIDLIIADIMMPELDGYDLLNILKYYSDYNSIPFIFLTAKGITCDKIKGYNLGCNSYITKPFVAYELLSIVNNLLNIHNSTLKQNHELNKFTADPLLPVFTHREKSILVLVTKGYTNKEIASSLYLSLSNVQKYVSRLLDKTNTRNRTELVNYILNTNNHLKGE